MNSNKINEDNFTKSHPRKLSSQKINNNIKDSFDIDEILSKLLTSRK